MNNVVTEKPDAVFFDWDGTLVDSYNLLENAHNHARQSLGLGAMADGEFKNYFGQPRDALYRRLYGDQMDEAKAIFEKYYVANHLQDIEILPGGERLMEMLFSFDIPMGVVTNKKTDFVAEEIKHLGWDRFFSSVVGSGDAEEDKPSGAPLKLAVEKAGIAEGACVWLVGDTENDVLCAQDAGHKTILVAPEHVQKDLSSRHNIDLIFHDCEKFHDFLLQYFEK